MILHPAASTLGVPYLFPHSGDHDCTKHHIAYIPSHSPYLSTDLHPLPLPIPCSSWSWSQHPTWCLSLPGIMQCCLTLKQAALQVGNRMQQQHMPRGEGAIEAPLGHKALMESSLQGTKWCSHSDTRWHCSALLVH